MKLLDKLDITVGALFAGRTLTRGTAAKAFAAQEQAVTDLNAALKATGRFSQEASKAIEEQPR